jgi:DNA-binding response OmpR family regulator
MTRSILAGLRVLVVEDEFMIAMLIEETLIDHDCIVVGPFTNLMDAVEAAQHEIIDLAVLDVNLRGEKVYPVAELLDQRGIPFLILSGYGKDAIPGNRPGWHACSKPFSPADLIRMLTAEMRLKIDGR